MTTKGYKHSEATKAKMSAAHLGRPKSPEAIAKTAAAHRGRKRSPEELAKQRASHLGKKLSPEHRAKLSASHSGSRHYQWNGGMYLHNGYRLILFPEHPYAIGGYVREHRLVMEAVIGRFLLPCEVVHHEDEDKLNNAAYNLILFPSKAAHSRYHTLRDGRRPPQRAHAGTTVASWLSTS